MPENHHYILKLLCYLQYSMPLQFTENALATRAVPCERLRCGMIIKPGEPRIAKEDIMNHIKYVCGSCARYYDEKEAAAKLGNVTHTSEP